MMATPPNEPRARRAGPVPRARRGVAAAAAAATLAAGACGDAGPGPAAESRPSLLRVVSPNGAEGAAVFELAGVAAVRAPAGRVFVQAGGAAGVTRAVLVLDEPGPLRLVVDPAPGATPRATLVEVAAPDDALRPSLAGYGVTAERVP
jgi:hypothetical protein